MLKEIRRNYRRLVAFVLAMVMVFTNVGMDLIEAYAAGETESALFLVDGAELKAAIREAGEQGEVFEFSSLELKARRKSIKNRYEKLLGTKEGEVYPLDLDIDDSYAPEYTSLELFYNAGTESVIFLFINESDLVVTFRVNIDGYETTPVTVNPNTANVEDEEEASYAENYESGDMIDDVQKKLGAEVLNPQETETEEESLSGNESEEETSETARESAGAEEETSETEEDRKAEEASEEAESTEEKESAEETETESEEAETEADNGADQEEESEDSGENAIEAEENSEAEETEESEEELLSLSRHRAAVVAVSVDLPEDGEEIELSSADEDGEEEEESGEEPENLKESKEEASEAEDEIGTTEDRETETTGESEDDSEGESGEEKINQEIGEGETTEETGEEKGKEEAENPGNGSAEEIIGEEPEDHEIKGENTEEPEGETDDEKPGHSEIGTGNEINTGGSEAEEDGQLLEDDTIEILGELKGKEYDLVTIRDHANAKAFRVALEDILDIETDDEMMEYVVDYIVNLPEAAAVTGADFVREGESLYFAVDPEEGYDIVSVTANGMDVEEIWDTSDIASSSDWKEHSHVYVLEFVEEDQWIEVELEEAEDPLLFLEPATYTARTDDAVITVDVPGGAFEEAVVLQVKKIDDEEELGELMAQANQVLEEGQALAGLLVYDVIFLSEETGDEVEPAVPVEVKFSVENALTAEEEQEMIGISVLHLPKDGEAEVMTSTEKTDETEFDFRADSFSPYGIALLSTAVQAEAKIGDTEYKTLQEAINAIGTEGVPSGATIILQRDIAGNILSSKKSYTLDMRGHVLESGITGQNVYTITEGTVIIKNGTITGGEQGSSTKWDGKGIKATNTNLTLINCAITENEGNDYGGGIYALGGSLTINRSSVTKNKSSSLYGGGIYAKNCQVTISGASSISENETANYGGALYVDGGSLVIDGGDSMVQINGNTNKSSGTYGNYGSVYVSRAEVTIRNAVLENNIYYAIGINNQAQKITIENVQAKGTDLVSAVNVYATGEVIIKDCKFNDSTLDGSLSSSIVRFQGLGGTKTVENCEFTGNRVADGKTASMGPVYITAGNAAIQNCTFTGNAGSKAGAVNKAGTGIISIENCVMTGNTGITAGAVYTTGNGGSVTVDGCQITDNTGGTGGSGASAGAIYHNQGPMTVTNTVIKENRGTNTNAGGGVYVYNATFTMPVAESGNNAIYNNNSEKNNANDINIGYNSAKVNVLPAPSMKDGDMDFGGFGYVWSNMNSTETTAELTSGSATTKTWTAMPTKRNVAKIGDTEYAALSEAMKAARSGDTVVLIAGDDGSGTRSLASDGMYVLGTGTAKGYTYLNLKELTIDLNGCSIYATGVANNTSSSNYGIFQIKNSGYKLTLTNSGNGAGAVGNRILVSAGATLDINGNVNVKSLAYSGDLANGIISSGIVNINHEVGAVTAKINDGSFTLTDKGAVETLTLSTASNKKIAVDISGSVKNLTLTQSGNTSTAYISRANIRGPIENLTLKQTGPSAVTLLDSRIETLFLQHYASGSKMPLTLAGDHFSVDKMTLRPYLYAPNPKMDEMANPTQKVPDIVMITNENRDASPEALENMRERVGYLANAIWENPNSTGSGDKNTLPWSGDKKNYRFLTTPVLNEEGDIVLRKTIPDGNYVFLNGVEGKDENDGENLGTPVKSFARAKEVLQKVHATNPGINTIYIMGTVTVSGAETWSLEEGLAVKRYPTYTGQMITVPRGSELTLAGVTIDGGNVPVNTPIIDNAGTLHIKNGENGASETILQNNNNIYKDILHEGGAVRNTGTLSMEGGTITGNTAVSGGGVFNSGTFHMSGGAISGNKASGTHVSSGTKNSSGKVVMTVHNAGGGVFIAYSGKMEMTGGTISDNTAYMGGGISLGNDHNVYIGGRLEMKEGDRAERPEITGNVAEKEGGGIFVQQDCRADITSGNITKNISSGGMFGGGGIYVNGGKGQGIPNGELHLENVKISGNTTSGDGGGIAACPSADVKIYLDNGGVIHGNQITGSNSESSDGKGDIYITSHVSGYYGAGRQVYISRYMKGNGLYKWTDITSGKPITSTKLRSGELSIYSDAERITAADESFSVFITDNEAAVNGGGVGTNGNVTIGTANGNSKPINLHVRKIWTDENGRELSAEELEAAGGVNDSNGSVTFKLWRRQKNRQKEQLETKEDTQISQSIMPGLPGLSRHQTFLVAASGEDDREGMSDEDMKMIADGWERVEDVQIGKVNQGEWAEYVFEGLMEVEEDGSEWEYTITEQPDDRYTSETVWDEEKQKWIIKNTAAYSILLEKEVKDLYGKYEDGTGFEFEIALSYVNKDGQNCVYTEEELKKMIADSGMPSGSIEIKESGSESSVLKVTLQKDESVALKGLKEGTRYSITEKNLPEDYDIPKVTVTVLDKRDSDFNERTTASVEDKKVLGGVNHVLFLNTTKEPRGTLEISKIVDNGGDTTKEWNFDVYLTEPDENGNENGDENSEEKLKPYVPEYGKMLTYTRYQDGRELEKGDVSVENGRIRLHKNDQETTGIVLKHGQSIRIEELTAGIHYTVTEAEANMDSYTATITVDGNEVEKKEGEPFAGTGTIEEGKNSSAVFTNSLDTGELTIRKEVLNSNLNNTDRTADFTFNIKLWDKEGKPLTSIVNGPEGGDAQKILEYPYTGSVIEGLENVEAPRPGNLQVTVGEESSEAQVQLKHGQEITITGLPVGTKYTVEEIHADGYSVMVSGGEVQQDENGAISAGIIKKAPSAEAYFKNIAKTSGLLISKTVSAANVSGENPKEFIFKVEFREKDGENELPGEYAYKALKGTGEGTVSSGGTISLKDGEAILIEGLPEGSKYTVTEEAASREGYTVQVQGGQEEKDSEGLVIGSTGTIEAGKGAEAAFTNHEDTGSLSIKKTVTGDGGEKDRPFTFHLILRRGSEAVLKGAYPYEGSSEEAGVEAPAAGILSLDDQGGGDVALKHGQKITISGLPVGTTYEVTETNVSEEDYKTISKNEKGTIEKKDEVKEAEFENEKKEIPKKPSNPTSPSGGNPGGPRGGNTPGGPGTTTDLDSPEVPLADFQDNAPTEHIIESDVPLTALPKTGDARHTAMLLFMFGMAGIGALLSAAGLKKRKDESDS